MTSAAVEMDSSSKRPMWSDPSLVGSFYYCTVGVNAIQ